MSSSILKPAMSLFSYYAHPEQIERLMLEADQAEQLGDTAKTKEIRDMLKLVQPNEYVQKDRVIKVYAAGMGFSGKSDVSQLRP